MNSLRKVIGELDKKHRTNIAMILSLDSRKNSVKSIYREMNRLYQSSMITSSKKLLSDSILKTSSLKLLGQEYLDYESLVIGASKNLKVFDKEYEIDDLERYITQAVIVQSLQKMNPTERNNFFTHPIDFSEIVDRAEIKNANLKGPITTLTAIQLGGLGGFSTYLSATTALAFVTSSVGLTLPFSAYIGLTSAISVITGPVGLFGVALWAGWKLTSPNWKKLIPVLIYIITYKNQISYHSMPENCTEG